MLFRSVEIIFRQGRIEDAQIGIYHCTCSGQTSWADFAKAIFNVNNLKHVVVNPISTEQYPTAAKRPAFSVLNNDKLRRVFKLQLPDWQEALAECAGADKNTSR